MGRSCLIESLVQRRERSTVHMTMAHLSLTFRERDREHTVGAEAVAIITIGAAHETVLKCFPDRGYEVAYVFTVCGSDAWRIGQRLQIRDKLAHGMDRDLLNVVGQEGAPHCIGNLPRREGAML